MSARSGMVKVSEDLWLNPYAVNAVELASDRRGSAVHIEAGVRVHVPDVRPNDLVEIMSKGLEIVRADDEPSAGFPRPVPAQEIVMNLQGHISPEEIRAAIRPGFPGPHIAYV